MKAKLFFMIIVSILFFISCNFTQGPMEWSSEITKIHLFNTETNKTLLVGDGHYPTLIKDASRILYKNENNLIVYDIASQKSQIIYNSISYNRNSISPDGNSIAVISDNKLLRINLNTSELNELHSFAKNYKNLGAPVYSSDGKNLLFLRTISILDNPNFSDSVIATIYNFTSDRVITIDTLFSTNYNRTWYSYSFVNNSEKFFLSAQGRKPNHNYETKITSFKSTEAPTINGVKVLGYSTKSWCGVGEAVYIYRSQAYENTGQRLLFWEYNLIDNSLVDLSPINKSMKFANGIKNMDSIIGVDSDSPTLIYIINLHNGEEDIYDPQVKEDIIDASFQSGLKNIAFETSKWLYE